MQRLALYLYFITMLTTAGCREQQDKASSHAFRSVYSRFDHFKYTASVRFSLDSVINIHPHLSFVDRYDYYTFMCGYYHVAERNGIKALAYTDSLLLLVTTQKHEPDNNITRQASAYLARGSVLFSLKKYNNALNYLYQSKVAAEEGNNTDIKSDVYYTIGMVMYRKLNFNQAAGFFTQSFNATNTKQPMDFGKFYRMQEVLNNVAESYVMAQKPDSALIYSAKAKAFIEANAPYYKEKKLLEIAKAVVEGTAGEAYLLKGDTAIAEAFLHESIAINSQPAYDNGNALQMQLTMARFYLDEGRKSSVKPAEINELLTAIGKGLDTIHNEEQKAKWNFLMSRYYDVTHDAATALMYLKQAMSYDKKTEAENKAFSETNINSYFQALQNQYEMQLLKKNSEMERIYLIISVVLSVLGAAIILLIWRHWHHSKRNVALLTRLNQKIKRQKKKLEKTLIALNKKSAEKDHILKVIAHDLRNPISAIHALSKLLRDDPTLDDEQIECLDLVSNASVESLELINAIMQMEGNPQIADTDKSLSDLNEIVLKCVSQIKVQATEKSQKLITHLPAEPQMVMINADKIQRVVKNLLSNAIKFSHKGDDITVRLTAENGSIIIRIQDKGIGIPEAMQHKVFDPFTEARRKGTDDEKTFGLGLSICKQFVEAHGGKIWFKSHENKGTSFYVKLAKAVAEPVANYSKSYVPADETA